MIRKQWPVPAYSLIILYALSGTSTAAGIFQWRNDSGITEFSDQAPQAGTPEVSQRAYADLAHENQDEKDDYFSVVNQAKRMESARNKRQELIRDRLKARTELLKAQNEAKRTAERRREQSDYRTEKYIVGWPYPLIHPRHPHHHRSHPFRPHRPFIPTPVPRQSGRWLR